MAKLPEDLRTALEGLRLLNEKFINPLSRLDQLLRVSVESYERISDAENRLATLQKEIEEANVAKEQLKQIEEQCQEKRKEHDKITKQIREDEKRLGELRDRIRRAQTMEP